MRRVLMITAAALALGLSGAIAAPMHSGGSFGGHGAAAFGGGRPAGTAGGVANGTMMAAPQTSAGANVRANNSAAPSHYTRNNIAATPSRVYRNGRYAWNGRGRRHWHGGGWGWGGGWGGLYAYEPGYDACYGNGYWPYYNGYYNNCSYDYYNEPGPGVSFGWGW